MALVWYKIGFRNGGVFQTGLTPTFVHLKQMNEPGFPNVTPQPTIYEIGNGQYAFQFDPEAKGEASAVVDGGSSLSSPNERYKEMFLTLDSSRIQAGISSTGQVVASQLVDKTGVALAADGVDLVMVESGVNLRQAFQVVSSACAGRATGAGTGTMTYYAIGAGNSGIARIVAATPGNGNRTSTTVFYT